MKDYYRSWDKINVDDMLDEEDKRIEEEEERQKAEAEKIAAKQEQEAKIGTVSMDISDIPQGLRKLEAERERVKGNEDWKSQESNAKILAEAHYSRSILLYDQDASVEEKFQKF